MDEQRSFLVGARKLTREGKHAARSTSLGGVNELPPVHCLSIA